MTLPGVARCGRCDIPITGQLDPEACWVCVGPLCYDCWDEHGECGHPASLKSSVWHETVHGEGNLLNEGIDE